MPGTVQGGGTWCPAKGSSPLAQESSDHTCRPRRASPGLLWSPSHLDLPPPVWLQVIVYVEDVNDEAPVFTQQQYSRLGLRETAGIGTSVIVVRATDRDTGEFGWGNEGVPFRRGTLRRWSLPLLPVILGMPQAPLFSSSQAGVGAPGTVLVASPPDAQA